MGKSSDTGKAVHASFLASLFGLGTLTVVAIGIRGSGYYMTPDRDRPFNADYELLKPTGLYGQGYGVIGSLMITSNERRSVSL